MTFEAYFRRYESIFEKDCEKWSDEKKVRHLLGKFGAAEHEKYVDFILPSTVNRYCERFQLNEITPDMFKCLIFIQRLISPSEKEVRTRLLTKLEQVQKINL